MLAWMLYAILLAALVGVAALAAEHAMRLLGRPTRWVWAVALVVSLLAPLLLPTVLDEPRESDMATAPTVSVPLEFVELASADVSPGAEAVTVVPSRSARFRRFDTALPWLWLAGSLAVVILLLVARLRLTVARQGWRRGRLLRAPVWLSRDSGPAVIGVLRPEIVVPESVLDRDRESQRLVLAHEREHVAARDPLLLACGWLAALAMPWNPAVWWQLRRLRLAVETDCDARVLASGRDVARYGALLLEVGRSSSLGMPAAAFAQPKSMLRRRIEAMTRQPPEHPVRLAAALAVLCGIAVATAAAVPAPEMPLELSRISPSEGQGAAAIDTVEPAVDIRKVSVQPQLANASEVQRAIAQSYPPLLRDAGVNGDALLKLVVDRDGSIRPGSVAVVNATHDAFGDVAMRVINSARFTPAKVDGGPVPVVLQLPVQFTTSGGFGMGGITAGDTTPEARLEALRRENARLRRELERLKSKQAKGTAYDSILREQIDEIQRIVTMRAASEEMQRISLDVTREGRLLGTAAAVNAGVSSSRASRIADAVPLKAAGVPLSEDVSIRGQIPGPVIPRRGFTGINEVQFTTSGRAIDGELVDDSISYPTISQVLPGSPAEKAGLVEGDVIVRINGKDPRRFRELGSPVAGVLYRMLIRRGGKERFVGIVAEPRPADATMRFLKAEILKQP